MAYIVANYMGNAVDGMKSMVFSNIPFLKNFVGNSQGKPKKEGAILNDQERYNI